MAGGGGAALNGALEECHAAARVWALVWHRRLRTLLPVVCMRRRVRPCVCANAWWYIQRVARHVACVCVCTRSTSHTHANQRSPSQPYTRAMVRTCRDSKSGMWRACTCLCLHALYFEHTNKASPSQPYTQSRYAPAERRSSPALHRLAAVSSSPAHVSTAATQHRSTLPHRPAPSVGRHGV